jgi:hypothetical protein
MWCLINSNKYWYINKLWNVIKISKEVYKSQQGLKHEWEYVPPTSNEAKRRRGLINGN